MYMTRDEGANEGLTLGAFHDRLSISNRDRHDAVSAAFRGHASALMRQLLLCRVPPRLRFGFPYLFPAVLREVAENFMECLFRCPVRNLNDQVDGAECNPLLARQLDRWFEPSIPHRARQVLTLLSSIIRRARRPDDDVGHQEKTIPQEWGHMRRGAGLPWALEAAPTVCHGCQHPVPVTA
jgi:hypothetical protein